MTVTKIVGVIPAHLASVRFPGKILFPFFDHPMIEHVRRRALLARELEDVYVATCDEDIANVISGYGGNVIMTGNHHLNGTTRVAEAIAEIDCTHAILLQGDEPLLLPEMVEKMIGAINANPSGDAWNGTGPLISTDELDRHSFVKCAVGRADHVTYCFRRSPGFAPFDQQRQYMRKVLGIIAYRRDFLKILPSLQPSPAEKTESIEQLRIIENGYGLTSVPFDFSLPSVNEPGEAQVIVDHIAADDRQKTILAQTFPH